MAISVDLSSLANWGNISGGSHTLTIVAKATGYRDSPPSTGVTFTKSGSTMPVKGDLITMNVDGTDKQFRVLKANNSVVEVVGMFNALENVQYGVSVARYVNSTLDSLLYQWGVSLNDIAKSAIIQKSFTQEVWALDSTGDPDYSGYYGTTNPGTTAYTISLVNPTAGDTISRSVYALSVQDVLDYVLDTSITDGQLQNYNIWKMLWDITTQPSTPPLRNLWLSSSAGISSEMAFFISGYYGSITSQNISNSTNLAVRPAFQIDLTKISWSPSV